MQGALIYHAFVMLCSAIYVFIDLRQNNGRTMAAAGAIIAAVLCPLMFVLSISEKLKGTRRG